MPRFLLSTVLILAAAWLTTGRIEADDWWSYRLSMYEEPRGQVRNTRSLLEPVSRYLDLSRTSNFAQIQLDLDLQPGTRLKLHGSAAQTDLYDDDHSARFRVKELYAVLSVNEWCDLYAGRKIVRWGAGYAYTPTGVLDPRRDPSDPDDRLHLNQGRDMVGMDISKGHHSISLVFSNPNIVSKGTLGGDGAQLAGRYGLLVHGLDLAAVGSWESGHPDRVGLNATYVIGSSLELHAEWLVQGGSDLSYPLVISETDPRRSYPMPPQEQNRLKTGHSISTFLVGANLTLNNGWNIVGEYYHNGEGLTDVEWERFREYLEYNASQAKAGGGAELSGRSLPELNLLWSTDFAARSNNRRDYLFLRTSKDDIWRGTSLEMLSIVGLDGGAMIVGEVSHPIGRHLSAFVRASRIWGRAGSEFRQIPVAGSASVGLVASF